MLKSRVLVVDDEENICTTLKGILDDEGFVVETAKNGALGLQKLKSFVPDVVLLDIWMPGDDGIEVLSKIRETAWAGHVIMMSGHGTIETAVKAIKLGAFDFVEKPIHYDKLLVILQNAAKFQKLADENDRLKAELRHEEKLIGTSEPMKRLKHLIDVTAPSNGWVLIQGENGTGKELVARSLHQNSLRAKYPFVAVNCAAIPEELIESELFGHEKGSFTGAFERKIGKFEQADGGTIFLDEVGDMASKLQAKILRVLEERQVTRVGGDQKTDLDFRVIAATNKDLKKEMREGRFREDLFFRLNVIPITVPALRERKEDIPLMVEHFMHRFARGKYQIISDETMHLLVQYPWPGNVRELKNWVERSCILSEEEKVDAPKLEQWSEVEKSDGESALFDLEEKSLKTARAAFEKQFILRMLSENDGNITKTAQMIGVERSHLHKKIKSYGIREFNHDS